MKAGIDWDYLQELAYGVLNLMPAQFWSLTLHEFSLMLKAKVKQVEQEREWEMFKLAQLSAWLLQPHTKKKLSATDFYNVNEKKERKKTTPEETKKLIAELSTEFGIER